MSYFPCIIHIVTLPYTLQTLTLYLTLTLSIIPNPLYLKFAPYQNVHDESRRCDNEKLATMQSISCVVIMMSVWSSPIGYRTTINIRLIHAIELIIKLYCKTNVVQCN